MRRPLNKITIAGFKSIKYLKDFELKQLNVLIGGNGAGKSNFVEIFRMLRAMVDERFAMYVEEKGNSDGFLFNGPKYTEKIEAEFFFDPNAYSFLLTPSANSQFVISNEWQKYCQNDWGCIASGNRESVLKANRHQKSTFYPNIPGVGHYVYQAISNWVVYHFHDTSASSPMRRFEITADNESLRPNAANLAPFLYELKLYEPASYEAIVESVKLVTPFFSDFDLRPRMMGDEEKINLSWNQKGSDYPMQPYHFSDGTIRFICLATSLLQPDLPSTIVIDEPELGLHPYAIEILAELIRAASEKTQVIISTQSPHLIDNFDPENIIVVDREDGASTFKRLDSDDLSEWLEEYSLGELWRKNVVSGGPMNEC